MSFPFPLSRPKTPTILLDLGFWVKKLGNRTTGNHQIYGGSGSDVFVLGEGKDVVSDFTDGVDKIGLKVEFEDLTVTQVSGDSVISLGVDSLTLTGVDSGLLTEEDFVSVI